MPVQVSLTLPANRLCTLADRHRTSPSAVARAVVVLVLSRWAGEDNPLGGADPTFGELLGHLDALDPPFTLSDVETGGRVELATNLVDATTASRLPEHCAIALENVAREPAQRVGQVDLLSPQERERILQEFNDTAAPFADKVGVYDLVQANAARGPDAVAVECGDVALTYRELTGQALPGRPRFSSTKAGPWPRTRMWCPSSARRTWRASCTRPGRPASTRA